MTEEQQEQQPELKTYEKYFGAITRISIATPMGNPFHDHCIKGAPNLFIGGSGVGKTERTWQESMGVGLQCRDVLLAQHPPEDISGVPVPTNDGLVIECIIGAIRELNKIGRGVLFLDEVGNATRTTQGAALSLLTTRRSGDTQMSDDIRILMATNPKSQTATGTGLLPAFANRTSHFHMREDFESFEEHVLNEGLEVIVEQSAKDLDEIVKKGWPKHWSDLKTTMLEFIRANREFFYNQPKTRSAQSGQAWCSPRTLMTAHRCVATSRCLGMPPELEAIMIEGWMGEAAAIEWVSYCANDDLPSAQKVLTEGWEIDNDRQDRTSTVTKSVRMFVLGIGNREEQIEMAIKAWEFLSKLEDNGHIDMVTPVAQAFANNKLGRGVSKELDKAVEPILRRIGKTPALKYLSRAK